MYPVSPTESHFQYKYLPLITRVNQEQLDQKLQDCKINGKNLLPRSISSITIQNNHLYLYGGYQYAIDIMKDFYKLNLNALQMHQLLYGRKLNVIMNQDHVADIQFVVIQIIFIYLVDKQLIQYQQMKYSFMTSNNNNGHNQKLITHIHNYWIIIVQHYMKINGSYLEDSIVVINVNTLMIYSVINLIKINGQNQIIKKEWNQHLEMVVLQLIIIKVYIYLEVKMEIQDIMIFGNLICQNQNGYLLLQIHLIIFQLVDQDIHQYLIKIIQLFMESQSKLMLKLLKQLKQYNCLNNVQERKRWEQQKKKTAMLQLFEVENKEIMNFQDDCNLAEKLKTSIILIGNPKQDLKLKKGILTEFGQQIISKFLQPLMGGIEYNQWKKTLCKRCTCSCCIQ